MQTHLGQSSARGDRPRVLHVSEAFGGGLAEAVAEYVQNTPDVDHYLLAGLHRGGAHLRPVDTPGLVKSVDLPRRLGSAVRTLRGVTRDLEPDVVHAHSTIAGAYQMLLAVLAAHPSGSRLVYSPHGFAMQREDASQLTRQMMWAYEKARARLGAEFVAAVGEHEASLAAACGARHVVRVNHAPVVGLHWSGPKARRPLRVVLVGRVIRQKDPEFLVRVLRRLGADRQRLEVTWCGDGEDRLVKMLRRARVAVTGWCSKQEIEKQLRDCDLYVHTAAWEGEPVSIAEAVTAGVPILARRIGALEPLAALGLHVVDDENQMAMELHRLTEADYGLLTAMAQRQQPLQARYRPEAQREALLEAWGFPG